MSTTPSKTKSRDKKVMNDSQKTPSKSSVSYNPLLGTFQAVESVSASGNGRFRNIIDESDSTGADCDSVSNNGSWSGDSEDHKEKVSNTAPSATTTAPKQEIVIPGADNDRREKMRLKNERKHQRQKEKRAQELHERCCQFLMSRKLELLAQQLVGMGFCHERSTHALMLSEGKLEESINWLVDDAESEDKATDNQIDPSSGSLKLDIAQELGSILELEAKYKCTKQDVERAVVQAEGDIEKAEESLRRHKQDSASRKPEEVSDNSTSVNNSKPPSVQLQPKPGMQEEAALVGYSRGSSSYVSEESGNPVERIRMKLQLMKMQQQNALMEEKKRLAYQQQTRSTEETHYATALSDQFKRQEIREPAMVMMQQQQQQQQLSQSSNANVLPVSTMIPSFTGVGSGWYPSEAAQSNGYLPSRALAPNDVNSNMMYQQLQYQQYQGSNSHRTTGGGSAPVAVAPAASLGLFSGYGSVGSTSGLDWNTDGSMGHMDYNNIDWSLDRGLNIPRPSQQYVTTSSFEAQMNGKPRMMGMAMGVQEAALVGNGREWTSPFEGKDLFSLSRQFVPPSL